MVFGYILLPHTDNPINRNKYHGTTFDESLRLEYWRHLICWRGSEEASPPVLSLGAPARLVEAPNEGSRPGGCPLARWKNTPQV